LTGSARATPATVPSPLLRRTGQNRFCVEILSAQRSWANLRPVTPPAVLEADISLRKASAVLAVAVLAGAGGILSLWVASDTATARVLSFTMKPNTALSLTLMAASLLLALRGAGRGAKALAIVAAAIGAATVFEYLSGVDLGIDQLVVREAPGGEGVYPGRMAPNAAQAIATLGAALVLYPDPGRRRTVAGWLALVVHVESVLALLGYLHGTTSLYQFARALRISQYTASGLLLLSMAALGTWPQGTPAHLLVRRTAGGLLARRILPPLLAVPVLLGLLRNAGERAGLYDDALGTALLTAGILVLVGVLVWFNARAIDRLDEAQRRVAAENQRLAAEARAAVATRDEFIALAGHELRTPLTAMRLRAQMEERRADPSRAPEAERWSRLIDRLARLVETMLDTSRLAQERIQLERNTIDLHGLLCSTVERLSAIFTLAEASVHLRAEPGIFVRGDPLRLEQAIENVLLNAAKYGARHDVEVSLVREGSWARLSVRDGGIGIAPADQERIFSRFERAAPASSFGGLGLGLYLVRQVMDAHGGTVTVDSVPGKGATFHLLLPLAPAAEAPSEASLRS
jgi:signal transduction histidine kinase